MVQAIADAETLLNRLRGTLATIDGEVTVHLGRQGTWTKGEVAAPREKSKHLPRVRTLFEITASRVGERVTFSDLLVGGPNSRHPTYTLRDLRQPAPTVEHTQHALLPTVTPCMSFRRVQTTQRRHR